MQGVYLPTEGYYCTAVQTPGRPGFQHYFFTKAEDAYQKAIDEDRRGRVSYLAQATFREAVNRKQANVLYLRAFFLDIDCGKKWLLKNQLEGIAALKKFIAETGLPFPAVTNSGNGLYAHWPLTENIPAIEWHPVATLLKAVVQAYSPAMAGDSSRTSDSSSVLRPPGTHNRKGSTERLVTLLKPADEVDFDEFKSRLEAAGKAVGAKPAPMKLPKQDGEVLNNNDFSIYLRDSDPRIIAQRCNFIRQCVEAKGNVSEPVWHAMIGVIHFALDGDRFIHEWSTGHPEYNEAETNKKIQNLEAAGVGPRSCANLATIWPEACNNCPYIGKISFPIHLGKPEPEPAAPPVNSVGEELIPPPQGFRRTKAGLCMVDADGMVMPPFYPYDFYPVMQAKDHTLGYEVVTWRHWLPHEGWQEFTMRSALVHDPKNFLMTLADNHVAVPPSQKGRNAMIAYAGGYLSELKKHRKISSLCTQMGWNDHNGQPSFVLGSKVFLRGQVTTVGFAKNVSPVVEHIHCKGELSAWVEATKVYRDRKVCPQAFAFLAAAFGAPLMKFTGFEGGLVSMVGHSGVGKTLTTHLALSVYGSSEHLIMLPKDTENGLVSRIGVYNSLPLVIDELTNLYPEQVSDLAYRITQGRDKVRLTKNATERRGVNRWNTLGLVTTNAPLYDKLMAFRADPSAEINRVFEYFVPDDAMIDAEAATEAYHAVRANYGHAGEKYITYLLNHYEEHVEKLKKLSQKIMKDARCPGEERYWVAIVATAMYGGLIAKDLGLIKFNIDEVYRWALKQLRINRTVRASVRQDVKLAIGRFIDEHISNMLVTSTEGEGSRALVTVVAAPRGRLLMARDIGKDASSKLLYISRSALQTWCQKTGLSYREVLQEAEDAGGLVDRYCKRTLGGRTEFAGAQQICIALDLDRAPGLKLVTPIIEKEESREQRG